MRKRIAVMVTVFVFGITSILGILPFNRPEEASAFSSSTEVRAVWLSYVDFGNLGLKTGSESTFRSKASSFLAKAKSNRMNTIYFQVRAFDDAAWKSNTFKASSYLSSKASSSKKAKDTYSFDPLKILTELAHKNGMELHAWMNPYRISFNYFWNPAYSSSTKRIQTAVEEVMAYDVDGIHFDDYFYHAEKGYKNLDNDSILKASKDPSSSKKKYYVNSMVRTIYSTVKSEDSSVKFGISPQGNVDNCRSSGADVDKWLSSSGYIDYLVPQIYWTDQWGRSGKTTMFTNRLKQWKSLNKAKFPMYVGLASYRTGVKYSDDPGWKKKSSNLADQLNKLRAYGFKGYSVFSAKDLYRSGAKTEMAGLSRVAGRIPTISTSYYNYNTILVKWGKLSGASRYEIYRATSKNGAYKHVGTISGSAGSYKNTGLTSGETYYYKVRAYYKSSSGKITYYPFSSVSTRTARPTVPSVSSAAGKRQVTVKWKKVSCISGYVVYRSTSKSGKYKAIKTVKSSKATKYTNKKLKKGKRYYYKVRAYKTVKGKRIYSGYSGYTSKKVK